MPVLLGTGWRGRDRVGRLTLNLARLPSLKVPSCRAWIGDAWFALAF